jgi:hypothetical protein
MDTLRCITDERRRGVVNAVAREMGARHPNVADTDLFSNRLQFTVPVFLASGTVLGVVRQKEFNDGLAGTADAIAVGLDLHPFCNRMDARCDQGTTSLHLNDAYPTGARGMMDL